MVNAHTHAAMVLFRGRSEGQSLLTMEGWYNSIREPELSLEAGDIGPAAAMASLIVITSALVCGIYYALQRWLDRGTQAWRLS